MIHMKEMMLEWLMRTDCKSVVCYCAGSNPAHLIFREVVAELVYALVSKTNDFTLEGSIPSNFKVHNHSSTLYNKKENKNYKYIDICIFLNGSKVNLRFIVELMVLINGLKLFFR